MHLNKSDNRPAAHLVESKQTESEARPGFILDEIPDALLCVNRNWKVTSANAEAIRLARLEPELFEKKTLWEMHPALEGSELERRFRAVLISGLPDQFEFFIEQTSSWVAMNAIPTEEGLRILFHDVTERKLRDESEKLGGKQIRQIFEALSDGVVIIDPDWNFVFANRCAQDIVGGVDVIGQNIFELFPGNGLEPFNTAYRTTMATRQPTEFEAYNAAPLNAWFRVQAKPYDDGIIVFFSDISARKHAEIRELETAHRLAQALDVTSDAIVTLDRGWHYTYVNRNARMLIDPEGNLLGRTLWEAFPASEGSPAAEMYRRAMDGRTGGYLEDFYPEPLNRWFAVHCEPSPDGIVLFFRDITAQREHDRVVEQQQRLLTAVQNASRLATWEHDLATDTITYGPGSCDLFGRPNHELSSFAALASVMLPGHAERIRSEVSEVLNSGKLAEMEFAVTGANGQTIWIESRGQSVPGEKPRMQGMSIDVTQRHINQQDLVASEARYRVLADLNPQAIWMGDQQGNITYANKGFMAYIGLSAEDLGRDGWLKAFAPQERDRITRLWSRSVTTGVDYDAEALLVHAETGEYRFWRLRAAPVRDAHGEILHWLGVGQDIHDTKTYTASLRAEQMETEQRRSELETIYKTSPIGLALLEPENLTFLNLNDHEAKMLGMPREDLIGRPLSDVAHPDRMPEVFALMRKAAAGTPVWDHLLEGELAATPGEKRSWSVNYAPIFNEDGTVRAITTASVEITNQKRAEAALIQSEKLAAVGRLASSISHEINNPLEAITNLLYLIALDESLPETLKVYVHMAQSELSRVSQIATQTLRFHRQAVAPTAVSSAELVNAVIQLYTGRLSNSHIKVDLRYRTHRKILCFENDIRQVLNNLIANAIDAMRKGGRLLIRAQDSTNMREGIARRGVRITVADTGHGMSEKTRRRIFEPFFTTKDLNGTGLGLWISAGIVERHQGQLSVRSSVDPRRHGTVFCLFLPCDEQPILAPDQTVA